MQYYLSSFGEFFNNKVPPRTGERTDFIELFFSKAGISLSSARIFVSYASDGFFYGTPSHRPGKLGDRRKRLSVLLSLLGTSEDESIVRDIQKIDPNFQYTNVLVPPEEYSR